MYVPAAFGLFIIGVVAYAVCQEVKITFLEKRNWICYAAQDEVWAEVLPA